VFPPTENCRRLSDHAPIILCLDCKDGTSTSLIPNKHFDYLTSSFLIEELGKAEISPESIQTKHLAARKKARETGYKPMKKIRSIPFAIKPPSDKLLQVCNDPNFLGTLKRKSDEYIHLIRANRFTKDSKMAFNALKRLTKYDKY